MSLDENVVEYGKMVQYINIPLEYANVPSQTEFQEYIVNRIKEHIVLGRDINIAQILEADCMLILKKKPPWMLVNLSDLNFEFNEPDENVNGGNNGGGRDDVEHEDENGNDGARRGDVEHEDENGNGGNGNDGGGRDDVEHEDENGNGGNGNGNGVDDVEHEPPPLEVEDQILQGLQAVNEFLQALLQGAVNVNNDLLLAVQAVQGNVQAILEPPVNDIVNQNQVVVNQNQVVAGQQQIGQQQPLQVGGVYPNSWTEAENMVILNRLRGARLNNIQRRNVFKYLLAELPPNRNYGNLSKHFRALLRAARGDSDRTQHDFSGEQLEELNNLATSYGL